MASNMTFNANLIPKTDGTLELGSSSKKWKINGGGASDQFLRGDGTWDVPEGTYELPPAGSTVLGGIKTGYTDSGKNYAVKLDNSGNAYVNVPWTDNNTTSFTITANATDGLWNITGTNGTNAVTYAVAPYTSQQNTASFDTSTTAPSLTTRLNYNGYLYATKLYSGGNEVLTSHQSLSGYIPKSTLSGAYDIMYSSAANTPARLAANTTSTKEFLSMTGTGTAGAAPSWSTVTKDDVELGNVENIALSTWTGSSNITTIGTLSSGTVPWARLSGVPSSFTPSSHTHGNIANGGTITSTHVALASGDKILFSDSSNSGKIERSSIEIGTGTTTYLRNDGTWGTPSGTYSLPLATSSARGGIKIGYTTSGKNYAVQLSDEQAYVNVPWTDTNTKMNVTLGTTTKAYLLGTSTTPTSTATAVTAIADTGVYLDTTAGKLTATTFAGNLSGNATTATTASKATAANITTTTNAIAKYSDTTGTFANTGVTIDSSDNIHANQFDGELSHSLTIGDKVYNGGENVTFFASDLGVSSALNFAGVIYETLPNRDDVGYPSTQNPVHLYIPTGNHQGSNIGDGSAGSINAGTVVICHDTQDEFLWSTDSQGQEGWYSLGLASSFALHNHTHGNITNDGAIGANSGLSVVTGTSGVLTTADLSVSDPATSGVSSSNQFISSISQSSNGQITATKHTLDTSGAWTGNAATATAFATGRTFQIKDSDNTNAGAESSAFDGTANLILNLPSTIKASLTGAASLNVLKAGDTMTDNLTIQKATATDTGFIVDNTNKNHKGALIIGGNSGYLGIWDTTNSKWVVYSDVSGNVTLNGNAATANKLAAARTINGTNFDGSTGITTANWGTARNISIADSDSTNTGTAVSVNGSAAVTLKLPATIKATLSGNAATATKATQDGSGNVITSTYVKKAGDTMTGNLACNKADAMVSVKDSTTTCYAGLYSHHGGNHGIYSNGYYASSTFTSSAKWLIYRGTDGEAHSAMKLYGAVWNDYAEYRVTKKNIEPGRCIIETGDDDLVLSTKRMQPGAEIVSDTFGFAIGQTDKAKTPIASNGRVLAYPFESVEEFRKNIGRPVCSGPNGTVSIMTDEEYQKYGYCAIGTISAIPSYEEWGEDKVKVNGRVWIRIK